MLQLKYKIGKDRKKAGKQPLLTTKKNGVVATPFFPKLLLNHENKPKNQYNYANQCQANRANRAGCQCNGHD